MDIIDKYKSTRQKLFVTEAIQPQSIKIATKGPVKNVHYLKIGKGKPLIMVHGGGSHSSEWIKILKPLAEYFQLYVVDRPGCGLTDYINYGNIAYKESATDFIRSFMDAIGLKKSFIIGNSMGGYFSICFALQYPERVEKLLLIGAPAGIKLWIPIQLRLSGIKRLNKILIKTIGKPSIKNVANLSQQLLVANVSNLSDDYLNHMYYSHLLPRFQESFLSMLENVLTIKGWRKKLYLGDQLDQLKVPVSFIWGDKDAFEKPDSGIKKQK